MKNNVSTFAKMKAKGEKISMLTAYDYSTAKIMDNCVNGILVGDSLGNVMLGYEDTLSVTMEDMITFGSAVSRACKNAMARANAVKLEGGVEMCDRIKAITNAGIPVMAHIGMTPQSVNAFGGFKVQGKSIDGARKMVEDALAVEKAGAFAVVIECAPTELCEYITEKLTIPTIGIGAGDGTDGQILVYQDMLGLFSDYVPKFVKRYELLGDKMVDAFKQYDKEVKNGSFPDKDHSFAIDKEIIDELRKEEK